MGDLPCAPRTNIHPSAPSLPFHLSPQPSKPLIRLGTGTPSHRDRKRQQIDRRGDHVNAIAPQPGDTRRDSRDHVRFLQQHRHDQEVGNRRSHLSPTAEPFQGDVDCAAKSTALGRHQDVLETAEAVDIQAAARSWMVSPHHANELLVIELPSNRQRRHHRRRQQQQVHLARMQAAFDRLTFGRQQGEVETRIRASIAATAGALRDACTASVATIRKTRRASAASKPRTSINAPSSDRIRVSGSLTSSARRVGTRPRRPAVNSRS